MIPKMTVNEAAVYLGTTRQKVHRLIKAGKISTEKNPLDERVRLLAVEDLDKLKAYPKPTRSKPKPKPEPPPPPPPQEPEPVKFRFTGQVKDNGWRLSRELDLSISTVKGFMQKLPGLEGMSYEELRQAAAKKFKKG